MGSKQETEMANAVEAKAGAEDGITAMSLLATITVMSAHIHMLDKIVLDLRSRVTALEKAEPNLSESNADERMN